MALFEALSTSATSSGCPLGFICMIFRDRLGGGGSAKASLAAVAAEDRLRAVPGETMVGDLGEVG